MADWRRVRIVVEVPVRGTVTDGDVRWLVQQSLQKSSFDSRLLGTLGVEATGRTLVKSYSKCLAAEPRRRVTETVRVVEVER